MFNYQQSIRQKIRFGYYAVVVMIVGLSIFTYFELNFIEKKIMFGEAISEFFDTTLEIRRFEKNYFLYEKRSDFDENLQYVTKAQELIVTNSAAFAAVTSEGQVPALAANLEKYKDHMERYEKLNQQRAAGQNGDSASIAAIGKDHPEVRQGHHHQRRRYRKNGAEKPAGHAGAVRAVCSSFPLQSW